MILYNSNYFGLPQLVTFSGSAVYRTTLPSLISTGVFFLYKYTFGSGENAEMINDDDGGALYTIHPFVIAIYILAFSLIINHRLNYCYQRYWESCSSIFMMSSKWMDSATALVAFHYQSTVYDEDRPRSFGTDDTCRNRWDYRAMRTSAPTSLNGDALDRTAASDSSDSGSSSASLSGEPSALTTSEARETSMESFRSFLSRGSRERRRSYSEQEQYERTKERFSNRGSIFNWKRLGKRGNSSLPDLEETLTERQNNIMSKDFMGNAPRTNVSTTPRKRNSSEFPKNQYSKRQSMPVVGPQTKERSSMAFAFGRYGSKWMSDENLGEKSKEPQNRHRRLPSTDIPLTGAGGTVIKSFKPNPSLDWQKKHYTSLPSNTGLHSTFYQTPLGFDYETQLLEEERERKQARQREINASKQRPGVRRNRSSLPNLRKSMARAIGTANTEITEDSERIASDPTRGSFSTMNNNNGKSSPNSMKRPTLPNFIPRLELHDLPSLHGRPSAKKAKVESDDESLPNPISPFSPGFKPQNNMIAYGSEVQRPASLRFSMKKMNGRASLFLQEAAHLFSLMSAVAMASLRADIEGVQSPLEDYVPGQKFPPVNPEEIRVKVFITEEDDGNGSVGSDRGIKFKHKNAFTNILMFLLGTSRNSRQRTIYNASRPFSVLGGVSDAEVAMLRKVRGHSAQHALCCLWLREFITREHLDGSTGGVAPPIVARVYQHISDGTQNWNNCRKTAFTDFPFPHAQLTSFFGFASLFIFPLLYFTYVNSTAIGVLMNIFTVGCFLGILEVAIELEQPFIRYPNDLPLNNYQAQFNEALISSLYGGFHPDAWGKAVDNGGLFSTTTCSEGEGNENSGNGEKSQIASSARSSLKTTTNTDDEDGIIGSEVSSSLERIVEVMSPNPPKQNIVQHSDL